MIEVTDKFLFTLRAGYSGSPLRKVRIPRREVFKQNDLMLTVRAGHGDIPPAWFWFDGPHIVQVLRGGRMLEFRGDPIRNFRTTGDILALRQPYAYRRIVLNCSNVKVGNLHNN